MNDSKAQKDRPQNDLGGKVQKKRVLIIEDEQDVVDMYMEILKEAGFDAVGVMGGEAGLEKMASEEWDLVLLDLMMPEMNGIEVLKKAKGDKEKYREVPIVALTNLSAESVVKEAHEQKADGYLMKTDLNPEELVEQVKRFVRR